MATGKTAAVKRVGGDDFPILCESCLGPNPYVRMLKDAWGAGCKVCERPFTLFRWRPAGDGMRPKKTEICQTCSRAKNVCQTCLLDLEYGLPVQVRDASLAASDRQLTIIPTSDGTREYTAAQMDRSIADGTIDTVYDKNSERKVNDIAERSRRMEPRYERNRTRICSFFVRGKCSRGLYCPYRHEKPDETRDPRLDKQNLRDRFYGVNDPVAAKILRKAGVSADGKYTSLPKRSGKPSAPPAPPSDRTIRTLFVNGITADVTEDDVRNVFLDVDGLRDVIMQHNRPFAFVEFHSRNHAETAMRKCHGAHVVKGAKLNVNWGKGKKRPFQDVPSAPAPIQSVDNRNEVHDTDDPKVPEGQQQSDTRSHLSEPSHGAHSPSPKRSKLDRQPTLGDSVD